MELQDVVRKRRMVRNFEDRPLPPGAADRIVANALRGPSAGFAQGTELLVVEGGADRERFWSAAVDPSYRDRMPWPGLERAPLVIVAFAHEGAYRARYAESDKRAAGRADPSWSVPWWVVDASFASLLVLLTAVDTGLGALFFGLRRPDEVKQAFGVPAAFGPVGAVAVGYPGADRQSPSLARARRPPAELVHRGHW